MRKAFFTISCIALCFVSSFANAKILFSTFCNGSIELYMMDDNGSNVQRLTNNQCADFTPRWSPDGSQIAFTRDMGERNNQQFDLFIMDIEGNNERRLTDHPKADGHQLTWLPDGKNIAFVSYRNNSHDIYVIELESDEITQLTAIRDSSLPDWSSDGNQIVYRKGRDIYVMDSDGTNEQLLGQKQMRFSRYPPLWSPNNNAILYMERESRVFKPEGILSANFVIHYKPFHNNQKIHPIPNTYKARRACWGSNGSEILFSAQVSDDPLNRMNIYRYHIQSREITQLPNTFGGNQFLEDWIDDAALAIEASEKLSIRWAQLKQKTF